MTAHTVRFSDELEKKIVDWRKEQDKIPTFQDAVVVLVEVGLRASDQVGGPWNHEASRLLRTIGEKK